MGRRVAIIATVLAAIVVASLVAWDVAWRINMARLASGLDASLTLVHRSLAGEIESYRTLPRVVAQDPRIADLIDTHGQATAGAVDRYLATVRAKTGADELFVMDATGVTLAASNWESTKSFVGHNYNFRPYFQDAITHGEGRFYAVGVTSGVPGYFLSYRVQGNSGRTGVVVVKVNFASIERAWRDTASRTALADAAGVIFLSGEESWKYRPLQNLSTQALNSIAAQRKYDGVNLEVQRPLFAEDVDLGGPDITMDNGDLMYRMIRLPEDEWTLIGASSISGPIGSANVIAMLTALVGVVMAGAVFIHRQRQQLVRFRLNQNAVLERRVDERTRELAREVDVRRRTEQHLRETQDELIHATKLAALGQMSAAITHEICQPISAMDSTLMAAERRAGANDHSEVVKLIGRARNLTRRMQHTIRHLRSFSRKEKGVAEPVVVAHCVMAALELAEPRARELGVEIETDAAVYPVSVRANAVRLEQVMLNLVLNALDAVEAVGDRRVSVSVGARAGRVWIEVSDSGPGIPEGIGEKMMEPFFTTKPGVEGLGLGLSISQSIVADFGGTMRFLPRPGGGTICEVSLPMLHSAQDAIAAQ